MPKQPHPAKRARFAAGLAGATGFVAMVPAIADGSEQTLSTDLASAVEAGRVAVPPTVDLDGSALAGAAARTPGGPVPTTFAPQPSQPETSVESSTTTQSQSVQTPASQTPVTQPQVTQAPTTRPPTSDTTSSAS